MRRLGAAAVAGLCLVCSGPGQACFGSRLRVGVPEQPQGALAAYAVGYFVQEKTGIEPEFFSAGEAALAAGTVDLLLAPAGAAAPPGVATRLAGAVPGMGEARVWLRGEVLDDLRFYTVDRALGLLPGFFSSAGYRQAVQSGAPPRKAARKAVLDGT